MNCTLARQEEIESQLWARLCDAEAALNRRRDAKYQPGTLRAYARALREWTLFVLDGKIPDRFK